MRTKHITTLLLCCLGMAGCAALFKGVVAPNRCQRCELINTLTNEVLWTEEGCGSANVRLEENCQIKAWELSRYSTGICDMDIQCETWKQEDGG